LTGDLTRTPDPFGLRALRLALSGVLAFLSRTYTARRLPQASLVLPFRSIPGGGLKKALLAVFRTSRAGQQRGRTA